jgi:hypothetical protein
MFLAGLLYSSWPLGYWLNPRANRGLASNLEALHQPYNWVFILFDIVSGALICIAVWWLLRFVRKHRRKDNVWLETAIIGVGIFGFLTALDAVLPLNCVETVQKCLPPLEDPYFVIHGIASIGSIFGLTLSIIAFWWLLARDGRVRHVARWTLHAMLFVWFAFGVGTAVLVARDRSSGLSEHFFILICSFWLAMVPYFIWEVLRLRPHYHGPMHDTFNRYRVAESRVATPQRTVQKRRSNTHSSQ